MGLKNVYIVWGAPASGKTTYVREHKNDNDLVVDFDLIKQAISMNNKTEDCGGLYQTAEAIREFLYQIIEKKEVDCDNAWVIGSLPKAEDRNILAKRLHAKLIWIRASEIECVARAMADSERKDKELQLTIIKRWFDRYKSVAYDNEERWD